MYLSELIPGEAGMITDIAPFPLRERLFELGFYGHVRCIAKAPFGGPTAYLIRGALIALREDDAQHVKVQSCDD